MIEKTGGTETNAERTRLRDGFERLRNEDRESTPDFDRMWRRAHHPADAPSPTGAWRLALAAAAITVIGGAAALLHRSSQTVSAPPLLSITEWKSPTDFLLDTPGREILDTIPKLGEPPAAIDPAPGAVPPSTLSTRKEIHS